MLLIDFDGRPHHYPMFSPNLLRQYSRTEGRKVFQYIEIFDEEVPREPHRLPLFNAYVRALIRVAGTIETITYIGDRVISGTNNT